MYNKICKTVHTKFNKHHKRVVHWRYHLENSKGAHGYLYGYVYIYIYIYIYKMDCVCQRYHKECSTRTCADDCYNCWKKSKLKSYVRPWLPPWRKGRISCLWIKSVFDCLTIGIIHETMVVHMTWVWTFFNNYIYIYTVRCRYNAVNFL